MRNLTYLITLWGGAQKYLLAAIQVQQLTTARAVCGYGCWGWSKRKLLDRVGWLSVSQLVFYHTVLQAHKTLQTGVPKSLYQSLSSDYHYKTRSAAIGQIRQDQKFSSQSSFKYRAMQCYNRVPSSIRVGSTATVLVFLLYCFSCQNQLALPRITSIDTNNIVLGLVDFTSNPLL